MILTATILPPARKLSPQDLADQADVIDCVGVFDCGPLPDSNIPTDASDLHARLHVEGVTKKDLAP